MQTLHEDPHSSLPSLPSLQFNLEAITVPMNTIPKSLSTHKQLAKFGFHLEVNIIQHFTFTQGLHLFPHIVDIARWSVSVPASIPNLCLHPGILEWFKMMKALAIGDLKHQQDTKHKTQNPWGPWEFWTGWLGWTRWPVAPGKGVQGPPSEPGKVQHEAPSKGSNRVMLLGTKTCKLDHLCSQYHRGYLPYLSIPFFRN